MNSNLPNWINEDLEKSGLAPDNFHIEVIKDVFELRERLGFSAIEDNLGKRIKLIENGGYWITYPNAPDYYRLKLRSPILTKNGTIKYLSPKKETGLGNKPYILPEVEKLLETYNPDKPIFITEGEKKAAKATIDGFPCIGLSGVWCFKNSENDFLPELDRYFWKGRSIYIVFDSDTSTKHGVRHAELRLAIELINRGAKVFIVRLPGGQDGSKNGVDDHLVRHGEEGFKVLVKEARPALELHVDEGTDAGLIFKEIVRLDNKIVHAKTLKLIAKREGVSTDVVTDEYRKHLPKKEEAEKKEVEVFTEEEISRANKLLKSPDILKDMLAFTEKLGFTGEAINQKVLYLSFTSRIMDKSISTIIKGQSSSGKSYLASIVLQLFPKIDILNFSFITPKALIHRERDLSHKILLIAEHTGGEGADYSIRTLLSEGEISILISEKDKATDKWAGEEKRVQATGLVFCETTTQERVHQENQTRLFDLHMDETEDQTKRILSILASQREATNSETPEEIKVWRAAQTLLKGFKVHIPYAGGLADNFTIYKIRARRDFQRLLSLIGAHTLLYQYQRETDSEGRLIATVGDFEAILPLAEIVLSQSMKEISPKREAVLKKIEEEFLDTPFSVKEIHEKNGRKPAYSTLQNWLKDFAKEGIVEWNAIKGAGSRYTLLSPDRSLVNNRILPPNILETINNNYLNPEIGNYGSLGISEGINLDYLKLPKTQNEAIQSNDNRDLGDK